MNVNIRKYMYWGLSVLSLSVILASVYFQLGGFEKVRLGTASEPYYSVAGKWLKGEISKNDEGRTFNDIKALVTTGQIKGTLCMIDYQSDTLEEREICRFIGVLLNDEISGIPKGLEVIEISAKTAYKAALTMHPLVMPNSQKTVDQLRSLATEKGDELSNYTMELYFEDNSVMVQMFAE